MCLMDGRRATNHSVRLRVTTNPQSSHKNNTAHELPMLSTKLETHYRGGRFLNQCSLYLLPENTSRAVVNTNHCL